MTIKRQITDEEVQAKRELYGNAAKHRAISRFLLDHYRVIVDLSYEVMEVKLGSPSYQDIPYVDYETHRRGISFTVYGPHQRETMTTLRRAIGGQWAKEATSWSFSIERTWNHPNEPGEDRAIEISIRASNRDQVCQKVVVGTEQVHIPARDAYTETREKVEWVCGNLLDN